MVGPDSLLPITRENSAWFGSNIVSKALLPRAHLGGIKPILRCLDNAINPQLVGSGCKFSCPQLSTWLPLPALGGRGRKRSWDHFDLDKAGQNPRHVKHARSLMVIMVSLILACAAGQEKPRKTRVLGPAKGHEATVLVSWHSVVQHRAGSSPRPPEGARASTEPLQLLPSEIRLD